jgi:dTDP-glucose 4,6-dehydratase
MPRAVVTGGAGFVGSHLCERLLREGWDVLSLDSLLTGRIANLDGFESHERFRFESHDVTTPISVEGDVHWVLHFASPASPSDYLSHPIHTLKVGALGTLNALGLAKAKGAGFLLASTSEVYGDPQVHPQAEEYWGNVNPIGPRGVYDEAKRYAEAMAMAYLRVHDVQVKIARIFNTYGPRLRRGDGRAVPTFVDDLVEGIWRLLTSDVVGMPVNLGNPEEVKVLDLARTIVLLAGSDSDVIFTERPINDPEVRCPDISRATSLLGWVPLIPLTDGLERTISWARETWRD